MRQSTLFLWCTRSILDWTVEEQSPDTMFRITRTADNQWEANYAEIWGGWLFQRVIMKLASLNDAQPNLNITKTTSVKPKSKARPTWNPPSTITTKYVCYGFETDTHHQMRQVGSCSRLEGCEPERNTEGVYRVLEGYPRQRGLTSGMWTTRAVLSVPRSTRLTL